MSGPRDRGPRLWRVEIELELYVVAETKDAAQELGMESAAKELANNGMSCLDAWATPVTSLGSVSTEWRDAYPYTDGNGPEATVSAMLAARASSGDGGVE